MRTDAALLLVVVISGCGGDDASSTSSSSSSSGASASSSSGSSGPVDGIPAGDPTAFNAWLQKKEYTAWRKESAPHPSAGPHGATVLTYLAPKLDGSLAAGSAEHPRGSAAVKEFIANGQVTGWAAYVKTQDASDTGKGWYWYEVFDSKPGASPIEGQGKTTCTGCHSAGKDFVRSPYPLQ